jgi:hypothetical protein
MYTSYRARLKEYVDAFSPVTGQTGALFAVNGRVTGFDLFDCVETCASVLPRLIESYALDAIDPDDRGSATADAEGPQLMLEDAARATVERFPAVGEGDDLRLHGDGISGGALVKDGEVVHLYVFRRVAQVVDSD